MRILFAFQNNEISKCVQNQNFLYDKADAEDTAEYIRSGIYDAVVVSGEKGLALLEQIRKEKLGIAVIAVSGGDAKLSYIKAGADYCVNEEDIGREFPAVLMGIAVRNCADSANDTNVRFGELSLDILSMTLKNGYKMVRLGKKESEIMYMLMTDSSRLIPKEKMLLKIWGWDSCVSENNVEVYISMLRKKLARITDSISIKSARGAGYYLLSNNGN